MKELLSLLTAKERRTAAIVGATLAVAACLILFVAFRERGAAKATAAALAAADRNYQSLVRSRNEAKKEWQAWGEARKDLDAVKTARLYTGRNVIQDLRWDIQHVFEDVGIVVEDMSYGYAELIKGGLQQMTVEFRFTGTYATFIRLLDRIERHPRFLHVERIDFLNVGRQPGLLEIKIGLVGTYER